MTRKAARPDDHGTIENERQAGITRLSVFWEQQSRRLAKTLDLKAIPNVADAYDYAAELALLVPVLRGSQQRLAEVGAYDVLALWNPDSDGWDPSMIEAYIAKAAQTNAERWGHAVTDELGRIVAADPANAADGLRAFLASNGLAVALAGGFLTGAASFGGWDAASKSGLTTKSWHTSSKKPRPSHAAMSGESVAIQDVFSNGLRWPGDHFGTAKDNANCTCRLTYGT